MNIDYAFFKWRILRKVLNEIGLCHVENALFYREGVISALNALNDNVQNVIKNFQ